MSLRTIAVMVIVVGAAAVSVLVATNRNAPAEVTLTTPYSAVQLADGQAYFGKLEHLGTDYPVLTDVYYVQRAINPETKETTNTLVKRGKEWHGPDRMILNARHIIFVEPVTEGSTVANLIEEAQKQ